MITYPALFPSIDIAMDFVVLFNRPCNIKLDTVLINKICSIRSMLGNLQLKLEDVQPYFFRADGSCI